jgi:hypothetical protein
MCEKSYSATRDAPKEASRATIEACEFCAVEREYDTAMSPVGGDAAADV